MRNLLFFAQRNRNDNNHREINRKGINTHVMNCQWSITVYASFNTVESCYNRECYDRVCLVLKLLIRL